MTINPNSKIYRASIVLVYAAMVFTTYPNEITKSIIYCLFGIVIWNNAVSINTKASQKEEAISYAVLACILVTLILVFPYYDMPFLSSGLVILFFALIGYASWIQHDQPNQMKPNNLANKLH